jgi:hypothetical protein
MMPEMTIIVASKRVRRRAKVGAVMGLGPGFYYGRGRILPPDRSVQPR